MSSDRTKQIFLWMTIYIYIYIYIYISVCVCVCVCVLASLFIIKVFRTFVFISFVIFIAFRCVLRPS